MNSNITQATATQPLDKRAPQNSNKTMGKRILAFILDFILWLIIYVIVTKRFGSYSNDNHDLHLSLNGVPSFIFLVTFLAYFIIFEWLAGGSLGKLSLGLRVTDTQANKLSFGRSLVRNLFRFIDDIPYFIPNLLGLIVASVGDRQQRIGDKVANSLVVKVRDNKSTSTKARLSLTLLIIIGIIVIIIVPASKKFSSSISSNSTYIPAIAWYNSTQDKRIARQVSNQVFKDTLNGNAKAVYQVAAPAFKDTYSEKQFTNNIRQIDSQLTSSSEPSAIASYPTKDLAQFSYKLQTKSGSKVLIIYLGPVDGKWRVYLDRLEPLNS